MQWVCPSCRHSVELEFNGPGMVQCQRCEKMFAVKPSDAATTTPPDHFSESAFIGSNVDMAVVTKGMDEWGVRGEKLEAAVSGKVRESADKKSGGFSWINSDTTKGGFFSTHYLLVTNRRVVLWARGLVRTSLDSFRYSEIRSVELQKGVLQSNIVFNVGRTENFTNVPNADARRVVNIINDRLLESA